MNDDKIYKNWKEEGPGSIALVRRAKSPHHFLVVANGCFDILHAGHLKLLSYAFCLPYLKSEFIRQVVLLNTDESIKESKGTHRPYVPFSGRAEALASLPWVYAVIGFSEPTPVELIKALEPDILVKGSEYLGDEIPGARFVVDRGGMVLFCPMALTAGPGSKPYSTTNIAIAKRLLPDKGP